jgi:transposase-like protein
MKNTSEKELDSLVPLALIHAIHDGVRSYEGTRLDQPRPCPSCGHTDYHKHDTRTRVFAVLITEDGFEEVPVTVQRYWCKHCEKPVDADMSELFYEECLYGKPIVDLCLYHAAQNPFNRVERILHTHYGIQVDRDTIQRYAELFADRIQDRHGVTVAGEPLSVNFLSALFGTETVQEFREEYTGELADEDITGLVGVADETYPAKKGAKKALRKENARRKAAGKDKKPYPEGFCLASAYLPQLGCFGSIQCRNTDFAWLLAATLVKPLEGVDYWIVDGESSYNGTVPDKEACLVHELRQLVRSDEHVAALRESGDLERLREHLEELYQTEWTERAAVLGEQYPAFWDEESETFTGPVTTNAIEGGNWRLKYELRTPYARCQGALARTALGALQDSMYVFRNGGPEMSFAHRVSDFSYEDVMGQSEPTGPNLAGTAATVAA